MRTQSSCSRAFQKLNYNKLKTPNAYSNSRSLNFYPQKGGEHRKDSFSLGRFSFQDLGGRFKADFNFRCPESSSLLPLPPLAL